MAPLAEELLSNPITLALIATIVAALVAWQSKLGPEDIPWFWKARRALWPLADAISRDYGRAWTREKDADDLNEYVFSTDATLAEIDAAVAEAGYDPNGLATLKFVIIDGERVDESRSYAWRESPDAEDQHHCYVFEWGGRRHCHQHVEPSPTDPAAHQHGEQIPGDPEGRLHDALTDFDPYVDGGWLDVMGE